jgi:allantoinase
MPLNASPVTTTLNAFNEKMNAAKNKLHVNVGFYGGLIPGNKNHLETLMQAGVLGIKCFLVHSGIDEFPNVGEKELEEAMPIIAKYNIPLLVHCEIYEVEIKTEFSTHPTSYKHYLESRPKKWENDAVDMMIRLCRRHNCPTHIVHVSSCEALEKIACAKLEGLPLTAESCAHYLYFNAEDIPDKNSLYKCAPPIRERENNILLKKAFRKGTLDFITTDHSPAPPAIKELESGNLQKAWGGIAGLQFLLTASWTAMKEYYSLNEFIPLLTEKPAQFLKIDNRKGKIKAGYDADLVIWNPEEKQIIKTEDILFRHKISPYIGKELVGAIQQTIVNGVTVYKDKKMINKEFINGRIIFNEQHNNLN